MAALIAAGAFPGLGSSAALPDINTTDPFEAIKASQACIVRLLSPSFPCLAQQERRPKRLARA